MDQQEQKFQIRVLVMNFCLVAATFAGVFISLKAYLSTKNEFNLLNRPHIGLVNEKIFEYATDSTTTFEGIIVDPGILLSMKIKNYGNLPAYFEAKYIDPHNEPKPFQTESSYISPEQGVELKWNNLLSNKSAHIDGCNEIQDRSIDIEYGINPSQIRYHTILRPKAIDAPINNREKLSADFKTVLYHCRGADDNQIRVIDWYVEDAN